MNYKIYVSAYLEESNQLLISFSSDGTDKEAMDYQSMAFDVIPYGDISAQEIVKEIAKVAPTICNDIITAESYTATDQKSIDLRGLVGQSFEFTEDELAGITVI